MTGRSAGEHVNRGNRRNSVLAALSLTLFLFSASVVLVLNARPLYYADITLLDIEREAGMDAARIRRNYDALIDYNQLWNREELIFPDFSMSEGGRIHFREVKRIFDALQVLAAVTGILCLVSVVRMRRTRDYRPLRTAGILSLLIPTVLGILCALGWERFFVTFHQLVFRNDYWLFDPRTDPVILILPDEFFLHCAAAILLCIVLGSVLYLALYKSRNPERRCQRRP